MSATHTENAAVHTVLVHLNCEVPEGVWHDVLEPLYEQYFAESNNSLSYEDWERTIGTTHAAALLGAEIAGAIEVGTDGENTPVLAETTVVVAMAEEF